MIVSEYYNNTSDPVTLVRKYSDSDCYLERDGVLYEEAIDPQNEYRQYIETDKKIIPFNLAYKKE